MFKESKTLMNDISNAKIGFHLIEDSMIDFFNLIVEERGIIRIKKQCAIDFGKKNISNVYFDIR
jgi:hypothetical protein